ncbi:hypothetical protein DTO013E5_6415 [Penicillium roqueforti]|uniref:Genomic scaffold, ProqFM164S04 n=1 Tax=Penicillium roqueforti (strain FM164) TaxID=1365484 RepID=W6QNN2_PENRF|nr:uncharacterized protein LCP9604111_7406 [Penicillium roqueforti]CDM35714.1 unnamed protein product [Penicillium roqueforti FM164]KAF9243972.1 hypothetical protein LCP9604111_7406 [Penicillium roqueforti]KAI1831350.1 hypothetical protein CBS147337_7816 [Penicillium roqueforti]KAI2671443.1 hypothetical protein CBS147355_8725 [Penicillium roqueforti]KAI2684792.1 hypothetical protein LCP963914a_4884 [Penicillium roqueforti]
MASNNHNDNHGKVPASKEQIIILPFAQSHSPSNTTGSPGPTTEELCEKCWKPALARQHSWSNEDRKHQLQKRLQGPQKGRETGFTEAHSGDQNSPKQHLVLR